MSIFRLALPGFPVERGRPEQMVLDSAMDSPKIDTTASPPHAAIIFINWQDTTGVPLDTVKLIDHFPHNLTHTPTVVASYKFDNGSNILRGVLPFQNGALGILTMDADETNINVKYYSIDGSIPATALTAFTMQLRYYVMAMAGQ